MAKETRKARTERELSEVLRHAYDFSYFGVQDLAGFGDFKPQKLHKLLDVASDLGLLVKASEGRTFGIQSRYCLNHAGVCRCHEEFDLPLKTHLQEEHQEETLGRLRLYEPVMRLMPRLFKSGVVDTPCVLPMDPDDDPRGVVIDEDTSLADFLWLQARVDVLRHGLGTYRTRNGYPVSLIIATVGLHHGARGHRGQAENVPRALQDFSHDLLGVPSFLHGLTPAAPSEVVFIVIDRLAGLYVQRTFPDLPKAVVDCQGNIIEKLVLSPPAGRFVGIPANTAVVRLPEREVRRLVDDPVAMALRGTPQNRVFEHINGYWGTTPRLSPNPPKR